MSDWSAQAACKNADTDIFFDRTRTDEALAFCGRCEVREQCLESAIESREIHGVLGGLTERERSRYARQRGLRWPTIRVKCAAPGCDVEPWKRRMCRAHWERWERYGQFEVPDVKRPSRERRFDRAAAWGVLQDVAVEFQVPLAVLSGRRQDRFAVDARQDAAVRLREMGLSLTQIGGLLGRDHTSIHHLLRRAERDVA